MNQWNVGMHCSLFSGMGKQKKKKTPFTDRETYKRRNVTNHFVRTFRRKRRKLEPKKKLSNTRFSFTGFNHRVTDVPHICAFRTNILIHYQMIACEDWYLPYTSGLHIIWENEMRNTCKITRENKSLVSSRDTKSPLDFAGWRPAFR